MSTSWRLCSCRIRVVSSVDVRSSVLDARNENSRTVVTTAISSTIFALVIPGAVSCGEEAEGLPFLCITDEDLIRGEDLGLLDIVGGEVRRNHQV